MATDEASGAASGADERLSDVTTEELIEEIRRRTEGASLVVMLQPHKTDPERTESTQWHSGSPIGGLGCALFAIFDIFIDTWLKPLLDRPEDE